jgi:hypothetical protein
MFLFSTSGPRETTAVNPVIDGIRHGADKTGVSFDYLVRTAQRESSLDPEAKARTSSATGLFQFIEQTWLGMVRSEGPRHGLEAEAKAITQGPDGRLNVSDPAQRSEIMALRRDPKVAAVMAGAFTQRNAEQLASALGRQPTGGELYIAHVLGARGAQDLIGSTLSAPQRAAARDFPEAAAANRSIFFDKAGKARSVAEVYNLLAQQHANVAAGAAPVAEARDASAPTERKGLMGLFSTGASSSPVSRSVASFWSGPVGQRVQLASLEPAQRFFPTTDTALPSESAAPRAETASDAARVVQAPVPPVRPSGLAIQPDGAVQRGRSAERKPLDLNAFLRKGVLR